MILYVIIYFFEARPNISIGLSNDVFDCMDETKPMIFFAIYQHFAGLHENYELDLIKIGMKLIFDLIIIQVDLSLVDIAINLPLIYYSFVSLGDYSN